ncbi:MAG: hypothetical protein Q9182_004701 [Xanthomendoza sp. 2 TL-2023]
MDPTRAVSSLTTAAGVLILAFVIRFLILLYTRRQRMRGLPKPPWSPIFGNLRVLGEATAASPPKTHPHVFLHWIRQRYPDLPPIFYLDIWPVGDPMLIVLDPAVARQYTVQKSLPKHEILKDFVNPIIGEKNLVTLEGKEWKMWRGIFNPGFASGHLMSLVGGMVSDTIRFTEILSEYSARGTLFELEDAATRLTVDIIGSVALDTSLHAQTTENELLSAFRNQVKWSPVLNDPNLFRVYNPIKFIIYRMNTSTMNRYLDKVLEQRFVTRRGEEVTVSKGSKPIIDLALDTYLQETGQSGASALPKHFKRSAIDQFKTFLFAGHDTTSSTACYIIHLLSKHPAVLDKVCQEHDEVYGSDTSKTAAAITEDPRSLNRLPYTMAVIREVLRLYPPVSTARQGDPDTHLHYNGKEYPTEGYMVWAVSYAMHRQPELWPNPEEFIPERFLVQEGDPLFPPKGAWRPFEHGPRNCIGQELAYIELKIFMVLTLRDFDIRPAYEDRDKLDGKDRSAYTINGDRAYQVLMATAKPALGYPAKVSRRNRKHESC